MVTQVEINVQADPTPTSTAVVTLATTTLEDENVCTGTEGDYNHEVTLASIGEIDIPIDPGLVIPNGDALCAETQGVCRQTSRSSAIRFLPPTPSSSTTLG